GALRTPRSLDYFLDVLHAAQVGNTGLLAEALTGWYRDPLLLNEGYYYAVECGEEVPFDDPDAIRATLDDLPPELRPGFENDILTELAICAVWGLADPDPVEDQPVRSDVPALVIAGEFDPITPPYWGQMAAETLTTSYLFTFPGLGHGVTDYDLCPLDIIAAFLAEPDEPPPAGCVDGMGSLLR
ncbi:MAG: hypothetical protein GYB65_13160, partial [Chloroflexi bacterium]|nr:hypothetical protein [Chloroflexota bacterium]